MYIREVQVKNFGKLKNRKFCFSPGLNVIYGENGAGKSTLQQFLMSMLFGMEKSRGRGSKENPYEKYEPWEAPAYYAGSMRFHTGEKDFYLERNFYHKERSAYLVNEQDREELSVEQGDLQMLLGGVSKAAYENTFFIRQGTILPKAELGNCLMDELHNLAETGDGSFELSRAFETLQQERKELEKKRRQAETEKNHQLELLDAQRQVLKERARKLEERYRAGREQIRQMQQEEQNRQMQREREAHKRNRQVQRTGLDREKDTGNGGRRDISFGIQAFVCIVLCILWLLLCLFVPFSRLAWLIGQAVLAVIAAGVLIVGKKSREPDQRSKNENLENRNTLPENMAFESEISRQRARLAVLAEELQENEMELENNRSVQSEVIESGGAYAGWDQEIRAISLAEETLQSLSAKKGEISAHKLDRAVSEIFCQITGGKYTKVVLSEKYEPRVTDDFKVRKPEAFSAGTMQQAYFAFRMAAGQFLEQEESLPFLLDEVFSMYDGKRLREVLQWLGKQDRQIFLFTCQEREAEYLRELGISFSEIILADEN